MKYQYIFILGNHPDLAGNEVKAYLTYLGIKASFLSVTREILLVNTDVIINAKKIIDFLGGTIKIGELVKTSKNISENIFCDLLKNNQDNLSFGLSFYNKHIDKFAILSYCKKIKRILNQDKKINFILPKDTACSSAQVKHKILKRKGVELLIIYANNEYLLAKTLAVQNINLYSRLDYGIPYINPKAGMLPPKLAQIMINLGLGNNKKPILYDPFCGYGRIILQSAFSGFKVYGSDINPKAVQATKENAKWLENTFDIEIKIDREKQIFILDATKENQIIPEKIDAIISEPDLGPAYKNKPNKIELEKIITNLSNLYIQSFATFDKILNDKAKIVFVFPIIDGVDILEKIIDKIKSLGYHKVSDFIYARNYQIVKRHISVFVFDKNK